MAQKTQKKQFPINKFAIGEKIITRWLCDDLMDPKNFGRIIYQIGYICGFNLGVSPAEYFVIWELNQDGKDLSDCAIDCVPENLLDKYQ